MTEGITDNSIIKRLPDHVATEIDGEAVVLEMKSGTYYGMRDVSALVWSLTAEPRTLREICVAVMAEYDIDAERCDRDVKAFVSTLASAGLLEISNATPA